MIIGSSFITNPFSTTAIARDLELGITCTVLALADVLPNTVSLTVCVKRSGGPRLALGGLSFMSRERISRSFPTATGSNYPRIRRDSITCGACTDRGGENRKGILGAT